LCAFFSCFNYLSERTILVMMEAQNLKRSAELNSTLKCPPPAGQTPPPQGHVSSFVPSPVECASPTTGTLYHPATPIPPGAIFHHTPSSPVPTFAVQKNESMNSHNVRTHTNLNPCPPFFHSPLSASLTYGVCFRNILVFSLNTPSPPLNN
jgi:hypothetical protein